MKRSGILAAASVAAASAAASSTATSSSAAANPTSQAPQPEIVSSKISANSGASSDKFAPRFDGLRFIETLVTAHR